MGSRTTVLGALVCATLASAYACAASSYGQPRGASGARRVPPPEAFQACDGKKAGDVVTFTTPRGETLRGTCRMFPARLVAMPDHPHGQQRPGQGQSNGGAWSGGPPNGQPSR